MSEIKWIKIKTDMFEDEKIDFISSLPEADALIVIWIRLLVMAGKCNAGGYIFLTERIPYTEEMLAHRFNKPTNIVKMALETFKRLEMIEIDERGIFIINWEKHQEVEKMKKLREQTRLRVARHREKKKLELMECNDVTHDVTLDVTQSNALDKDIDIDKEINNIPPLFEEFWKLYPRKVRKKDALKRWKSVTKTEEPRLIIEATKNYAKEIQRKKTAPDYIMHPPTFLNNERWKDYLVTNHTPTKTPAQLAIDREIALNRWIESGGDPNEFRFDP